MPFEGAAKSRSGQSMQGLFSHLLIIVILSLCSSTCDMVGQSEVVNLRVEISPENGGVTSPPSRKFTAGETITLRAIPNERDEFLFEGWEGDLESEENPVELTLGSDMRIVARFMSKPRTITFTIQGEGSVQHRPAHQDYEYRSELVSEYQNGAEIELLANPSPGWEFVQWRGENFTFNRPSNPEFMSIWKDVRLSVIFREVDP